MHAIIMAGGQGSRLRPLTCNVPKPLAPLCGRPVVEYIIELLIKHGCEKAALTLMYKGKKIEKHFEDGSYNGLRLDFIYENEPLGTAGSVKNASKSMSGDIIVISADAMCDFDLGAALEQHRRNNADATIIAKRVEDPREYGLINIDDERRITGFLEKPSYASCITDLANTGVYILSQRALSLIPDNRSVDFAMDIFPLMLEKNMRLFTVEENGYWCDIGDFHSYIKCQNDMLSNRVKCDIKGHRSLEGIITNGNINLDEVKVNGPVYFGSGVKIGAGTIISPGTVIGDNVTIGRNSKIHSSIILSGSYIGDNVSCNHAVLCENAKLMSGSAVYEGAVIGEGAHIHENSIVEKGVKLWPSKQLQSDSTASYDVKYGYARSLICDEDGICGETNAVITPEIMARLGSSAVSLSENKIVGISHNGGNCANALQLAFVAGAMAAGGTVWDFGECIESEFEFAMRKSKVPIAAYINSGISTNVRLLDRGAMPLTRKQERKLEGCLNRAEYAKAAHNEFGSKEDMSSIPKLYITELGELAGERITGIKATVKSINPRINELLTPILTRINDIDGEEIVFNISSNGKRLSAHTNRTGLINHDKLALIACQYFFKRRIDVALPHDFPSVADEVANLYNVNLYRYYSCSCDSSDEKARNIARENAFVSDGIILSLILIKFLSDEGITLEDAVSNIPEFHKTNRFITFESSPLALIKSFGDVGGTISEGVTLKDENGKVIIRPLKTGRGLLLYAEAVNSEVASELCDVYEKKIKGMHLDS